MKTCDILDNSFYIFINIFT